MICWFCKLLKRIIGRVLENHTLLLKIPMKVRNRLMLSAFWNWLNTKAQVFQADDLQVIPVTRQV